MSGAGNPSRLAEGHAGGRGRGRAAVAVAGRAQVGLLGRPTAPARAGDLVLPGALLLRAVEVVVALEAVLTALSTKSSLSSWV